MNGINGLNFYESLNKLIMGFLIFVLFVGTNSGSFVEPLLLIYAYIVGCIYQALVQVVTKSYFSLQEKDIEKVYNEVSKNEKESCKDKIIAFMKDLIWPLYLIYKKLTSKELPDKMKKKYLKAYYKLAKAGLLMNIPVLEALENFMRNLMPIIFFDFILCFFNRSGISIVRKFIPFFKDSLSSVCIYKILSVVLFILTIWVRRYYQQTIYRLVWEGDKYLDEINNKGNQEEEQKEEQN